MLAKFRGHLRSHVVAYVALFFALSGTALAAKPLLTGSDIQDGSLTTADVQNESLTGADVLDDSLKGADVDELSLDSSAFHIAGAVNADGTIARGSGFSIGGAAGLDGLYNVIIDGPTPFECPGLRVTPNVVLVASPNNSNRTLEVQNEGCEPEFATGVEDRFLFTVVTKGLDSIPVDTAFSFIAVQG
jgi:hypothetical protein